MKFNDILKNAEGLNFCESFGLITKVNRDSVRAFIPGAQVGSLVVAKGKARDIFLEVVSLDAQGHIAMPLDDLSGVQLGDRVMISELLPQIPVGPELLGRVIDSRCVPIDFKGPIHLREHTSLSVDSLNPMSRNIIRDPIDLGVRSINSCLTCGRGQRAGIFAGSGVGKSVLLGMMARYTSADVVVVGLIGERGKELREFIENELGEEGMMKSVVVVETADKSPIRRARGAYVATSVAEYFRKQGLQVLLLMDSLTRFAMALREIGVAAGEPPTTKGYTPSVFHGISRLVERAGNFGDQGSITGLYTVLVEGDDLEDPVADSARSLLDGHIVLSRKLSNKGHYPAVDILQSVSRVMDQVVAKEQLFQARKIRQNLSKYLENEDAISLGLYNRGSDIGIDESIEMYPKIVSFLNQSRDEKANYFDSKTQLSELLK